MIRKVSIVFIIGLLMGCGSTKQATQIEQLPDWVKSKPIIDGFYVGFGSAQKTYNVSEYQTAAKNNALADMASEISVNVSSQSVLQRFENTAGFSEDFNSSTKLSARESLEGYEQINTHETETQYYVLYKLSKAHYKEIQDKRRNDAIAKGSNFLNKATADYTNIEVFSAIINYLKGMQVIKPYFNEHLEYESENGSGDLGNDLYDGFLSAINSITVEPKLKKIDATKGKTVGADQLEFTFKTTNGEPIYGLPVMFSLGTKPLRNNKAKTDINGKVNYTITNMAFKTGSAYFVAILDANAIALQGTNDPLLRRMVRKTDMPAGTTLIELENPSFYVSSKEFNLGKDLNPKIIKKKMEQLLSNNNYPVVYEKQNADFIIDILTDTEKQQKQGRMCTSVLKGEIKVFNASDELVLTRDIRDIKGVQLNYVDAGMDAYNNLSQYLNRNFLPKLKEALQ